MSISDDRLEAVDRRLMDLTSEVHSNHIELINKIDDLYNSQNEKINSLQLTVKEHAGHFAWMNKLVFGGGILTAASYFKDLFKH